MGERKIKEFITDTLGYKTIPRFIVSVSTTSAVIVAFVFVYTSAVSQCSCVYPAISYGEYASDGRNYTPLDALFSNITAGNGTTLYPAGSAFSHPCPAYETP